MLGLYRRTLGKDRQYYRFVRRIFGARARNVELYKLALIHRSASVVLPDRSVINNERLEFLGDAVIESIVSEMLFIDYPEMNEGSLTQLRSRIVSRETLNELSIALGIDQQIIANPASINLTKQNVYGDAFEALVGALYLDKGYNRTNRTLIRIFEQKLDIQKMHSTERDFKSRIIEWGQKHRKSVEFRSKMTSGSSQLSPNFETTLTVGGEVVGYGSGRSKKEAEQRAASKFYEQSDPSAIK